MIAEAFGSLDDRLVVVRSGKVSSLDEQGQVRPTGKQVAGAVMRIGDDDFIVTTEELWRQAGETLRWVPIRPTDGELRGVLDYGGLWLATSTGVVLPERLAEDQMLARLGSVLSARRAVAFSDQTQRALAQRGLELPTEDPAWATWLPQVTFLFDQRGAAWVCATWKLRCRPEDLGRTSSTPSANGATTSSTQAGEPSSS